MSQQHKALSKDNKAMSYREYGKPSTDDFGTFVFINVENLSDCHRIEEEELDCLVQLMKEVREENNEVLTILEEEKTPYLFSSADLARLVATTESLRTKLNMGACMYVHG